MAAKKSNTKKESASKEVESASRLPASRLIDGKIEELADWRGRGKSHQRDGREVLAGRVDGRHAIAGQSDEGSISDSQEKKDKDLSGRGVQNVEAGKKRY